MGKEVCSESLKNTHKSTKECSAWKDYRDGEGQFWAMTLIGHIQLFIRLALILHLCRQILHPHQNLQPSLPLDDGDSECKQLVYSCYKVKQYIHLCQLWKQDGSKGHTFHNQLLLLKDITSLFIRYDKVLNWFCKLLRCYHS